MIPTEEERTKLEEFQHSSDDIMLGSAEQFLAMLCSIPDLSARLRLWAFRLDYETVESVSAVIDTSIYKYCRYLTCRSCNSKSYCGRSLNKVGQSRWSTP